MNNKMVVAVVMLIAALSVCYINSLTGFIPAVSVGVAPSSAVQINLNFNSSIYYRQSQNITAESLNIGSMPIDQRIEVYIRDTNLTYLATYLDGYNTLQPGQTRGFQVTYLPNMTGFHWIYVKVPFAVGEQTKWGIFYVRPPDPIYVYIGGESSGGGTRTVQEKIQHVGPFIIDLEIEYQKDIVMLRQQSYVTPIILRNQGNVELQNISVNLRYILPVVDLIPKEIESLPPGASVTLLLYLTVPKEFELGQYPVEFDVMTGNESLATKTITIDIRESNLKEEAYMMLTNYMYISHIIEREMLLASIDGKDISNVTGFVESAKQGINEALKMFNKEEYQATIDKLQNDVKPDLEAATRELAKLVAISIILPGFLTYLILILALILVPLMILLFWRFRKKNKEE